MGHFANLDYKAITRQNSKNLDNTSNGSTVDFGQSIDVIVIGDGHTAATQAWWKDNFRRGQWAEGKITVTKGKGTDPGTMTVTGLLGGYRDYFAAEIGKFSKKKIVFT